MNLDQPREAYMEHIALSNIVTCIYCKLEHYRVKDAA